MTSTDLQATIAHMGGAARAASTRMAAAATASKNAALTALARLLREQPAALQAANTKDIVAATAAGLAAPLVDRLKLTPAIIETIAQGCEQIAAMPDPIGEITGLALRPSGIQVGHMRVPLGVFGMIYESRPNVTIEAASLAIKSGTPAFCVAAPKRFIPTSHCGSWCRLRSPKPACRPMRCNWCRPPTAPPWAT